jgi:hypothetical protein
MKPVFGEGSSLSLFGMLGSHARVERTLLEVLRPQGDSYRGIDMFCRHNIDPMITTTFSFQNLKQE